MTEQTTGTEQAQTKVVKGITVYWSETLRAWVTIPPKEPRRR
jgi:hypothetical protein